MKMFFSIETGRSIFSKDKSIEREENDWTDRFLSPFDRNKDQFNREEFLQWFQNQINSFQSIGLIDNAFGNRTFS